jgi:hypothetical protein
MSALTKDERDGLEEVFLSIQSHRDKYRKIKDVSSLIISHTSSTDYAKLLKQAKYRLNETKLSHFLLSLTKKKKNLSK